MDIELLQSKLHPYEHIVEEMEYRGWTYNDLSDASGLSEEDTKKLLEGKLFIDGDVAESLSRAFGTSKEVWLNLQNKYRENKGGKLTNKTILDIKKMMKALKWSVFSIDGGKTKFVYDLKTGKLFVGGNKTNLMKLYRALKEQYKSLIGDTTRENNNGSGSVN